ncbi:hypothetical protein LTR17_027670 [Elasticomyces elasticus]|nr:hypothetical protein LTR17_027670 [Elasticomyces elasticus]
MVDYVDFVTGVMSSEEPLPDIEKIILRLSQPKKAERAYDFCPDHGLLGATKALRSITYIAGESYFEALWSTLIGNIANFEPAQPSFVQHFSALIDMLLLRERGIYFTRTRLSKDIDIDPQVLQQIYVDTIAQELWQSAQHRDSKPYFSELVNTISGRVFITTLAGYIGFASPGAMVGDRVALLGGGWTPFILREHSSQYTMVGDSYIHGLMNGEYFHSRRKLVMNRVRIS